MGKQGPTKDELKRAFSFGTIFQEFFQKNWRPKGNYVCPFHRDTDPSLAPHFDHGYCHGACDRSYDIFDLYYLAQGDDDFKRAKKYFAERLGGFSGETGPKPPKIKVREYVYHDYEGNVVYKTERFKVGEGKTFGQVAWTGTEWNRSSGCMSKVRRYLYHVRAVLAEKEHVCLCAGEKDVESLEALGYVATTNSEGERTKNWKNQCDEWKIYEPLIGKKVSVFEDNDKTGRAHCESIAATFIEHKIDYRIIRLPGLELLNPKADVTDWLEAGHTKEELKAFLDAVWAQPRQEKWKLRTIDGATLYKMDLPPLKEIIEGVLYEGLTIIGAAPKMGKTLLCLEAGLAVSAGDKFLGSFGTITGDVLCICLQDGIRRLQRRIRNLWPKEWHQEIKRIHFAERSQRLASDPADMGLLKQIEEFCQDYPKTILIILDTLEDVRPEAIRRKGAYSQDVSDITPLQHFARDHQIAVIIVHHIRKETEKLKDADPVAALSGTSGISGSVDHIWLLQRTRGHPQAVLRIDSRDLTETKELLIQQKQTGGWTCLGDAQTVRDQTLKGRIYAAMMEAEGRTMTIDEIVAAVESNRPPIQNALTAMSKEDPPRVQKSIGRRGTWIAMENTMESI